MEEECWLCKLFEENNFACKEYHRDDYLMLVESFRYHIPMGILKEHKRSFSRYDKKKIRRICNRIFKEDYYIDWHKREHRGHVHFYIKTEERVNA